MTKFEVIFYEKEHGECPVEQFLSALDLKMRVKMVGLLEILEEKGNLLREPYSRHLDDGIYEIRCKVGNNITRVLYFFLLWRKDCSYKRVCEKNTENPRGRNRTG